MHNYGQKNNNIAFYFLWLMCLLFFWSHGWAEMYPTCVKAMKKYNCDSKICLVCSLKGKRLPSIVLCQYVQLWSFLPVRRLPHQAALTLPETQKRTFVPGNQFHHPLCCTDGPLEHCCLCHQVWVMPKHSDKHAYFLQLPWLHCP